MNLKQLDSFEQYRWEQERIRKQLKFDQELRRFINPHDYTFVSFTESDTIQLASDGWPDNKWQDKLCLQVDLKAFSAVTRIIERFIHLTQHKFCYLFCMNYNFGLVRIATNSILQHWQQVLEIDGEELFLSHAGQSYFLSIYKKEEVIVGRESEGMKWIYEVTYSNARLKQELEESRA